PVTSRQRRLARKGSERRAPRENCSATFCIDAVRAPSLRSFPVMSTGRTDPRFTDSALMTFAPRDSGCPGRRRVPSLHDEVREDDGGDTLFPDGFDDSLRELRLDLLEAPGRRRFFERDAPEISDGCFTAAGGEVRHFLFRDLRGNFCGDRDAEVVSGAL